MNEPVQEKVLFDEREQPTNVRWFVFALAFGASWFLYLHRYTWGVITPEIMKEYGLDEADMGLLLLPFSIAYALCQIPTGLLGDLLGPRRVLGTIIFLWSALVALPAAAVGFWSLAILRALFGVAQAGAYPNLGKVTRSWFPLSIRTTIQGMVASFGGRSGGACASIVVATLLMGSLGLTWRWALFWIALAGISFAVVFHVFFRNTPAEHPLTNEAERRLIGSDTAPATSKIKVKINPDRTVRWSFGFLLVHMFTSAFADMLYVYWIPLFLEQGKGLTKVEMGIYASLPLFGGAIGGMVGGTLNDVLLRVTGRRRLSRTVVGLTGKLVAAVLVVIAIGIEDGRTVMVVIAGAKFFTDWSQPTVWGAITDISGSAAGRIFGTVNMFGSIGGAVANPLLGMIKKYFDWNPVFYTIAGMYLVAGLCWLGINTTKPLVLDDENEEERDGEHEVDEET